jgi:hypothetical protein
MDRFIKAALGLCIVAVLGGCESLAATGSATGVSSSYSNNSSSSDSSSYKDNRYYNDCFFAASLSDWRPLDDRHLIMFAPRRRPYLVELARPVPGLSYEYMIGVYDRDGQICPYGGDSIIVDGLFREQVRIVSMRRLSEDEVDDVLTEFGINPPAVVSVSEVDVDDAQDGGHGESQGDTE